MYQKKKKKNEIFKVERMKTSNLSKIRFFLVNFVQEVTEEPKGKLVHAYRLTNCK